MKELSKIAFSLLFLAAASSFYAQTQDPPDPSELKLRVIERQYDDISDKDRWEIKALYPEIRLKGDVPAARINELTKSLVLGEVERFKTQIAENAAESMAPPDGMKFDLLINYSVEYLDSNIVSIRFNYYEFTGGAHPNSGTSSINYDLRKERKIDLADLFTPGSAFVEFISEESVVSLKKQMDTAFDSGWVEEGAGPDLKKFESWTITNKGLMIAFDPYQVAHYSAGSFEVVIPFEKFPYETRGEYFNAAETATYIDGSPPNHCRGGRWTMQDADYSLATVLGTKNTRSYFYKDDEDCPNGKNCKANAYLIGGDEVIVQREYGDFSCAWFRPAKGAETVGWLKTDEIKARVDAAKPPTNWIGNWSYSSSDIAIKVTPGGKLHVYGTAFWKGMGDNVHIGEIDFLGVPAVNSISLGDGEDEFDCRVKLKRLGKYLLVSDNLNCGGVNVSFNGVYVRQ